MPRHLMEDLAKAEGYCCLWACLHYNKAIKSGAFANRYGVSRQTIIYFRRKLRQKNLHCQMAKLCLKAIIDQALA